MRGISKATIELILFARKLLAEAYPMTLRQLHYAIFSASVIAYANTQAEYKRLSKATTLARRAYRDWELSDKTFAETKALLAGEIPDNSIPPHWMVDETRNPETQNVFDGAESYIETVEHSYRRDNWQTQAAYCEIWSEKATILGSIRPVAEELGITLRVCHGYGSCGMEMQIGDHFQTVKEPYSQKRKPITVFYLGDHDPSGHDIQRDVHEKVQRACGFTFEMRRLAIHAADIKAYNLPPQMIKTTDSRTPAFLREHGADANTVELDALPATELRRRVSEAVRSLIDMEAWQRAVEAQKVEQRSIDEGTRLMRKLLGRK